MKIVYCVSQLAHKGGAERIVISKANALVSRFDCEVHILIADQKNRPICYPLDERVICHDMHVSSLVTKYVIPGVTFLYMIYKLRRIYTKKLEAIAPDVVSVIERGYDDFVIPFICKEIPKIREFHLSREAANIKSDNVVGLCQRIKTKCLNRIVYSQFDKYDMVVLLTQRDKLYANYSTSVCVIPNFIPQLPPQVSNLETKQVISVGRLDRNKNFRDQILAWKIVQAKHPDWKLMIYGEGEERENLQKMIEKENLIDKVFLCGVSDDIYTKYLNSSMLLFTSRAEGFGMVLIEGMSLGLPCISYDSPCGPSEIIKSNNNGYLLDMDDWKGLADKILFLIDNPGIRKQMGRNARITAQMYTQSMVMPHWIELFKKMKNKK